MQSNRRGPAIGHQGHGPPVDHTDIGNPVGRPAILPGDLMHKMIREGLTNKEIADVLAQDGHPSVTRQGVSAWRIRNGYGSMREVVPDREKLVPWKIAEKDNRHRFYRCLMIITRMRAGLAVSDKDRARADKLVRELFEAGAVIHYDRVNGWQSVRARDVDLDLIRHPGVDDKGNTITFDPSA